ncbi:MAG: acyl-CoA thioesterase domain-containing protein [Actinomycetes bacterium]
MDYAPDLASALDLERLDLDLFRARNTESARERPALYGGQVCAQALMAASLTVGEDRLPHSLHGYFLRPGLVDRPVVLRVDRDRDGRSFSARHVAAVQDGEVIFSMLASFQTGADPAVFADVVAPDEPITHVPGPDDCGEFGNDVVLDLRQVTMTEVVDGRQLYTDTLWVRSAAPLPDDPVVQACALAYVSDLGTGFGRVVLPTRGNGGPSIDHGFWFHAPVRVDDWLLMELVPWKATLGRGTYRGTIRSRAGSVAGVIAQEHILHPDGINRR